MFEELERIGYQNYLFKSGLHLELDVDMKKYVEALKIENIDQDSALKSKLVKNLWSSVDPKNKIPFPIEMDDLIRLHFLVTTRKVTTILEFGIGSSTAVFDHALTQNRIKYYDFASKNLRSSNLFECHSIDNNKSWIKYVKNKYNLHNTFIHYSVCRMGTFNDRICTYYDYMPNVCPDLIYLDGPDQQNTKGGIRGISTRSPDRLPMAADILAIENLLLPGTLIVIDGRAGNARFLKCNLQRNWTYSYIEKYDQHFLELNEKTLGRINSLKLDFTTS
jgi:hypothetical protein